MNHPKKRVRSKTSSLVWTAAIVIFLTLHLVIQSQKNQTNDQTALFQNEKAVPYSSEAGVQKALPSSGKAGQQQKLEKDTEAQQADLKHQDEHDVSNSKTRSVDSSTTSKKQTPANSNRPPPLDSSRQLTTGKSKLELGQLRDLGGKVWESAAGLKYGPGSQEKHRLLHVMRHSKDQPNRPGKHGVFSGQGERKKVLALIDEAYLKAQKGSKNVERKKEGNRVVYTVNMGRRIGFVGGQVGNKQGKPPAYKIRLVLEGSNVITAFPL